MPESQDESNSSDPPRWVLCFTSLDDFREKLSSKLEELCYHVGEVTFDPTMVMCHWIGDPHRQLNLLTRYLQKNLPEDRFRKIEGGFDVLILHDPSSSFDCQILIEEETLETVDQFLAEVGFHRERSLDEAKESYSGAPTSGAC